MYFKRKQSKIEIFVFSAILLTVGICVAYSISSTSIHNIFALSKGNNTILITHLSTIPQVINVGTHFKINATILNNSTHPITFVIGCTESPLAATFDRNVQIYTITHTADCMWVSSKTINPGENSIVQSPHMFKYYVATNSGNKIANVTFNYEGENTNGEIYSIMHLNIAKNNITRS